jgi:hypothetical protein
MGSQALYALIIDDHIKTSQSNTAFQLTNRLYIVHMTKRDGSIVKYYVII